MTPEKIVLIVNTVPYETNRYFADCLKSAFERQGVSVTTVDAAHLDEEKIREIYNERPDFTFSFCQMAPNAQGKFLWDYLEIPHLTYVHDPMIFHLNLTKSPYSAVACVDRFDVIQLKEKGFKPCFFLPHAADRAIEMGAGNREFDVVMTGSLYDYGHVKKRLENEQPKEIQKIVWESIDRTLDSADCHFVEAIEEKLDEHGIEATDERVVELAYYVDYYIRGYERIEMLKTFKDLDVHIWGNTYLGDNADDNPWTEELSKLPNLHRHPATSFAESIEILKRAKVCLNCCSAFKEGAHERIFTGMMAGALVATNDNAYCREIFDPAKELLLYTYRNRHAVVEQVKDYLKDESARKTACEQARETASAKHTWDHRAAAILENAST